MTENENSVIKTQMKRLWIAIGLIFLMNVLIVIIVVYNDLLLYIRVLDRTFELAVLLNSTYIFVTFVTVVFFAVMIAALARA